MLGERLYITVPISCHKQELNQKQTEGKGMNAREGTPLKGHGDVTSSLENVREKNTWSERWCLSALACNISTLYVICYQCDVQFNPDQR